MLRITNNLQTKLKAQKLFKSLRRIYLPLSLLLYANLSFAGPAVFEAGSANLPATTNNTFTRINFDVPFAPGTTPNVFTMTTEDGDDPCKIRIRNVDNTGFDAVCLEPSNEDGNHPGMVFEYIATINGDLQVPLAGGGGNATFRSACIETSAQIYSANCDSCSGPTAFVPLTFVPPFSAAPAFVSEIQTTENRVTPGGDPIFIDVSVQQGSVSASGANVSIERMEAGVGPIPAATPERICYLAVERTGCQSLDFSSLGGPATPVTFNAANGARIVDGHDNGCSIGEGVAFTPACFSGTPAVAIAGKLSRFGVDGGMLRRCNVNADQIILTFDEDQISDPERSHTAEATSVMAFSQTFTTPVTLNQARVSMFGRTALFEWQTSAEIFHLGYHLWGLIDEQWVQLNKRLIKGDGTDYAGVRDYNHRVRLKLEQAREISQFGISTVDTAGYEEFFGPFTQDEDYGEEAINEPIDWQSTRENFEQGLVDKGYQQVNGRWRKTGKRRTKKLINRALGLNQTVLAMTVNKSGVHALSESNIATITNEFFGVPLDEVAVSLNGEAIPRYIASNDDLFNAGDVIYFVGIAPEGSDGIYLTHNEYRLTKNPSLVVAATQFDGAAELDDVFNREALFQSTLSSAQRYSAVLATDDPWYDSELFAIGNPVSKLYEFELPNHVNREAGIVFDIRVFGSIDYPQADPDHHLQIRVNGKLQKDIFFDGLIEESIKFEVAADQLQLGVNTLSFTLPADTGYNADLVLIDQITLTTTQALSSNTEYHFQQNFDDIGYELNVSATDAQVFAWMKNGTLSVVQPSQTDNGELRFAALPNTASQTTTLYSVAPSSAWPLPADLRLIESNTNHQLEAEFLIVVHPAFMGDKLQEFVEHKESKGYSVKVVSWLDVVDTYGYGNDTPQALENYLKQSIEHSTLKYLLIVGGHTYDYLDISGQGVMNFIPAHYRPVGIFGFAPTDNPYADLDSDNLPDIAIGRWPVRTPQDLASIIDKTLTWESNLEQNMFQDSLLIAQKKDSRSLDFRTQMEGKIGLQLAQNQNFGSISRVYLEDIEDSGASDPVATARTSIDAALNAGASMVSFAGHASSAAWGSQSVVNTSFIQQLTNIDKPTVVMPLACYTTYYESTDINTLAHQWLFAGAQGAAAIHGASVLGDYNENAVFAERYLKQAKTKQTIGEAILNAKREMSSRNEMLHNWALLGDPSLPIN